METASTAWPEKSVNSLTQRYVPNTDSMEQDNHVAATKVKTGDLHMPLQNLLVLDLTDFLVKLDIN